MAYNFQDIDPESIDYKQQSDEARKKRMALAAAVMTGGTFPELMTQYATDRVAQASDKLGQVGQTLENPQQAVEQRLGMQPQPTQPTLPVVPQQMAPVQAQQPQQEAVKPVTPEQVPQMQLPQPGPGVQVAGAQPNAGLAQVAQQQQAQPMPSQTPDWHDKLVTNNVNSLSAILADPNTPEDVKSEAQDRIYNLLTDARLSQKANQTLQNAASGDPRAVSDLSKELTKKSTEGSLLKAMFYARMGLTEMAKDEQQKLGAGVKYEAVVGPDNTRALIKYGADNMPLSGFDETGKALSTESLAKFAANAMPTKAHLMPSVHGSPVVNARGEMGTLMYDPRSQANYVQVGNERRPTAGWTTMAQNVQNVYNATQASALGKGAGEGFTPTPMKPLPGSVPQVQPAAQVQATPAPQATGPVNPAQPLPQAPAPRVPVPQAQATPAPAAPATPMPGGGIAQQKANLEVQTARIKEEQKPPAEAKGKIAAKDINNQNFADSTYGLIKPINDAILQSTGSGIGASVDTLASKIGASTKGAQAIAQLEVLAYPILSNVPRFEGAQSDYDVKNYMRAAGDFANPDKPVNTRLAALQAMVTILKKYDKAGTNDWTFGGKGIKEQTETKPQSTGGTTSTGNKYKRIE